jgi:HD-like signal output (HDOD) protein
MFRNQVNYQTRLSLVTQQTSSEDRESSTFLLPGEAEFPSPPARPDALLRLELALSEWVTDLEGISHIVGGDIGLTIQLLRLAAREMPESAGTMVTIGEMVIHLGVEKLATLVARTEALPYHVSHSDLSLCERFWTHSRLTALVAEELAGQSTDVRPQDAHLAGLLCHLGNLPQLLGWQAASPGAVNSSNRGHRIAHAWGFPRALADVIGGDREVCLTAESRALLDIVTIADTWAYRLEFLAIRESQRAHARAPLHKLRNG